MSPDAEDPEADLKSEDDKKNEDAEQDSKMREDGNVNRISTRQWAVDNDYDAKTLFNKFFFDDINYLLTMDKLWSKRKPPTPLKWGEYSDEEKQKEASADIRDQVVWNIDHCARVFSDSIKQLKQNLKVRKFLIKSYFKPVIPVLRK